MSGSTSAVTQRRARRRVPWGPVLLVGALALFAVGIVRLIELRFDAGDVFPPYSTLRGDPLGAKVFFSSLEGLPGLQVERNERPLPSLGREAMRPAGYDNGESAFTCFYLGADTTDWPFLFSPEAVERLESIAARGGRLVITFLPAQTLPTTGNLDYERRRRADHSRLKNPTAKRLAEKSQPPDLVKRWGLDFRRQDPKRDAAKSDGRQTPPASPSPTPAADATPPPPEFALPDPALLGAGGPDAAFAAEPAKVPWHSVIDFDLDTPAAKTEGWHALYRRSGRPVIVARPFGKSGGELILASDTYFLSNEGLRNDPRPALLAALVGAGRRVIFDENHLGVNEQPGLMTLARRYHLQGAMAALGVLVGLFVWRNVVSLVPVRLPKASGEREDDVVLGNDAGSGFLNLLRRSVRPRDLPAVCLAQWQGTATPGAGGGGRREGPAATPGAIERVRAILAEEAARPARQRSPAAAVYRAMCAALGRQKAEGRRQKAEGENGS